MDDISKVDDGRMMASETIEQDQIVGGCAVITSHNGSVSWSIVQLANGRTLANHIPSRELAIAMAGGAAELLGLMD